MASRVSRSSSSVRESKDLPATVRPVATITNDEENDDDSIVEIDSEEFLTLRHVKDSLPLSVWLIAVVELCERFAYYGLSGPFMNYMQNDRSSKDPPGALGLGQSGATALSYFFQFWCYVTPLLGAYIADTYWGKYKTIFYFACFYSFGILILFTTALPSAIEKNGASLGGLIAAMIIIGLGTGGIKSNVSPLIAEQYTNTRYRTKTLKKTGEKVVVDPSITIQSIFMIFYFCINVGSLSAIATTTMEMKIGFWSAYLLPFCFFFVGLIVLVAGKKRYVNKPPKGSVIIDAFKVIFIAVRNKNFEAAKPTIRQENGSSPVKWTDQYVEEVKRAIYACKVFCFYPIYWTVYGQMVNNFISQGGTMQTHGIPNDIMQNINPITLIIFIPICDKLVYPGLRKIGIKFKPITRITWGFLLAAASMGYAAIVQKLVYNAGPCYDHPRDCPAGMLEDGSTLPNEIHIAIQTPAYVLIGLSEVFASITGLEYAYTKAPASMKSFIMSMFLLTNAFGALLGMAVSPTAKDPQLVWMYTGLAIATGITGCIFWVLFKKYNAIEAELNAMDAAENERILDSMEQEKKPDEKV